MRLSIFQEPDLEFGAGGKHIDVRYGLSAFGPLDVEADRAPKQLRVGLVGTQESVDGIRSWLERCRAEVPGKDSRLTHLFPAFPGFSEEASFRACLVFHDRWCSSISQREVDAAIAQSDGEDRHGGDETVRQAVAMFVDHAEDLVQQGGPMVLVLIWK